MKSITIIMLALLSVSCSMPAMQSSESFAKPRIDPEIEAARVRMEAERRQIVEASLGLSVQEVIEFWPVYDEYREAINKLGDRRLGLIQRYADAYNSNSLSDALIRALLDEQLAIEADQLKLQRSFVKRFSKVLPARKLARYYQIEHRLDTLLDVGLSTQIPLME